MIILFLLSGLVLVLWISSLPVIVIPNNWKCFEDIIEKSSKDKISFKAALPVSLKGNRKNNNSKIRVLFD